MRLRTVIYYPFGNKFLPGLEIANPLPIGDNFWFNLTETKRASTLPFENSMWRNCWIASSRTLGSLFLPDFVGLKGPGVLRWSAFQSPGIGRAVF
jgi:hypothetical protein